jgi:hypothetical protein
MERWLTIDEASTELRCTRDAIMGLLASKQLVGVRTADGGYRILDPAAALRRNMLEPAFERFPFLSLKEVSEVTGLSFEAVRWYVRYKRLHAARIPNGPRYKVVAVGELRRFLADYEKRKGPGRKTYSPIIVRWLKKYLAEDLKPNAGVLQELMEKVVVLPEPQRSIARARLWRLFDEVDALLKSARNGPDGETRTLDRLLPKQEG